MVFFYNILLLKYITIIQLVKILYGEIALHFELVLVREGGSVVNERDLYLVVRIEVNGWFYIIIGSKSGSKVRFSRRKVRLSVFAILVLPKSG